MNIIENSKKIKINGIMFMINYKVIQIIILNFKNLSPLEFQLKPFHK